MHFGKKAAAFFFAILFTLCLASCGAPADNGTTGDVSAPAEEESVPVSAAQQSSAQTQPTAEQPSEEQTEEDEDTPATFVFGTWNDGKDIEYTFDSDNTGTIVSVSKKTREAFRYAVNQKKEKIIFYTGEKEKKETVKYSMQDETHMTLTYSGKKEVKLTFGNLITEKTVPFRMGVWQADDKTEYVFRTDGSGTVRSPEQSGAGTAFQYEVNSDSNLLIFHMGSADDTTPAVYSAIDGTHMHISFETAVVELTWKGEEKA